MDNPRPEKVAVVDEVRRRLDGSDAAILTEYRGLKVKDLESLRRSLRSNGGEYKIYKNTLVRRAAQDSGLDGLDPLLTGPTGITFVSGDASAVRRRVTRCSTMKARNGQKPATTIATKVHNPRRYRSTTITTVTR